MLRTHAYLWFALVWLVTGPFAQASTHGVSVFGDLKYDASFTHFDYVNPNAPKGGNVTLAAIGTYDSLNPYLLKGVSAIGLDYTTDTLMAASSDEAGAAYALIATSAQVAKDKKSITFNLNTQARWHNGTPITSEDVVFSFNTLMKFGHPQYGIFFADVETATAIGLHQVTFTFKNTDNRELPLIIAQSLPIISKAYYSAHDFDKTTLEPPLSSGPYKISDVEAGRSITYQRVDDYWAKDLPVNKGRYNFDSITFDYYRDANIAVEAFKAGEFDFRRENISKVWATSYNLPHLDDGRMIKEELPDGTPTGMQCFVFNIRQEKFQDPRVRQALNLAYDFEWANKQLFFSAYARNTSFFGNSDFASSGLPTEQELALLEPYKASLPEALFTQAYTLPTTDGMGNNRQYLIEAQTLLNEAGWKIKDLVRIDPSTGKQATIEFLLASPSFERVVAPYIRNLKKLGIKATIRTVDVSQYIKRREQFDYDIIVHWFGQGNAPGNEQLNYWHSSVKDKPGSMNLIGIDHPAVDAMVENIIQATDKPSLIHATRALDRVLLWNNYVIPQWHSRTHRVIYWSKLKRPSLTPAYDLGFDSWWIKE